MGVAILNQRARGKFPIDALLEGLVEIGARPPRELANAGGGTRSILDHSRDVGGRSLAHAPNRAFANQDPARALLVISPICAPDFNDPLEVIAQVDVQAEARHLPREVETVLA
eukprot:5169380-Alexandrium_andersonii.AAC.1